MIRMKKVRTTDYRPPGACPPPPLERQNDTARPGAVACPKISQKNQAGSHEAIVASYSDATLEALINDIGRRNLSNLRDHETRFLAERSKAARAERRARKAAGNYNP